MEYQSFLQAGAGYHKGGGADHPLKHTPRWSGNSRCIRENSSELIELSSNVFVITRAAYINDIAFMPAKKYRKLTLLSPISRAVATGGLQPPPPPLIF